jgi:hypothetical protein
MNHEEVVIKVKAVEYDKEKCHVPGTPTSSRTESPLKKFYLSSTTYFS